MRTDRKGETMMATLRNDFHNTYASVRYTPGEPLTDSQVKRAARKLCGMSDCRCSDGTGIRGPQDATVVVEQQCDLGYTVTIFEHDD